MKKKSAVKKTDNRTPTRLGNAVFIRSVTHFYTGRIVALSKEEIVLADAAWIADTGRHAAMLLDPAVLVEVEPYPDGVTVAVGQGAVVDVCSWPHPLPRKVKPEPR